MFPAQESIPSFEHPLTRAECSELTENWNVENIRYFRLPIVPLGRQLVAEKRLWEIDHWLLRNCSTLRRYSTVVVMKLRG
jgi:hypothetical protein